MQFSRIFSLLFISLVCAGCSWFTWLPWVDDPDDDKEKDKPAKLVDFDRELDLKIKWGAKIGDGLGKKYLRLSPALVADRVIAADGYGAVEARDRFSGKRVWQTKTHELNKGFFKSLNFIDRTDPSFISGGVGAGSGMALLGSTDGEVIALSAGDGSLIWSTRLGSEVLAVPAVGNDMVFAQTIDGRLVALQQADGEVAWTYDNQVPILTLRGTSSPVVFQGIVYAGFANGKIIAFRASNGEPIWEHRVKLPEGRSELDRMVDVDGRPLLAGGSIYVGAYHGYVKGLSLRDGRPLWEEELSTYLDLAEGYGQIYAIDEDDIITAFDQNSGEVVWTQEAFRLRKLGPPLAFSNYLLVGDEDGYIHVIAQRDGRLLGRRKIDGKGVRSNLSVQDGTIYALGNSGKLRALEIELR